MRTNIRKKWLMRCSEVNHQSLKNKIIMGLKKYFSVSLNDDFDSYMEEADCTLDQWRELHGNMARVILDFQHHMSPRNLFDSSPLDQCSDDTKEWLGDVIHLLWLSKRHDVTIEELSSKALKKLALADVASIAVSEVIKAWKQGEISELSPDDTEQFELFHENCLKLSEAISRFPKSIL